MLPIIYPKTRFTYTLVDRAEKEELVYEDVQDQRNAPNVNGRPYDINAVAPAILQAGYVGNSVTSKPRYLKRPRSLSLERT